MKFEETNLKGAYIIEIEKNEDYRGFFARTFDKNSFLKLNLEIELFQSNVSFNKKAGTLRGMHYQKHPHEEVKIVRCTKGKIYDVIIDLRTDSNSYKKWFGIELTYENHKMMYVPKGFAHGFLTLSSKTEISYKTSDFYYPELERSISWEDKSLKIKLPVKKTDLIISDKDKKALTVEEVI